MEALIMSCGTGGGHNAAAQALQEELLRRGHCARMFNPYELKSDGLANAVNQAYVKIAQKSPRTFGAIYKIGNAYRRLPCHSPVYYANAGMVECMEAYLAQHRTDVILMPHIFPAEILTQMRLQGKVVPPSIFVATDYVCIPFTEEVRCDAYVIPAKDLTSDFTERGISEDRIYPLGIPVRRSFSEPVGRTEARSLLGVQAEERLILVAGGSIGAGRLQEAVRILDARYRNEPGTRIAVICGNNRALYASIQERYGDRMDVLSQTERMAEYMAACDVFLSKPGGLSSTESAALGVPLVHMNPIPGCETYNMRYFFERGMSMPVEYPAKELLGAIEELQRPDVRARMLEMQKKHINAHAAADICDLAERLCGEKAAESPKE